MPITKTTADELLEGDTYRIVNDKNFRKIKSIIELPNSYYASPVGHKIMIVTDHSNQSILTNTEVEIFETKPKLETKLK